MKERTIKCGDIYWLELQHSTGHQFSKKRPHLIIDSDNYLANSNLVCVVPMTSNLKNQSKYDVLIEADNRNSLKYDSLAKLDHLYTFNRWQLVDYGGSVCQEVMKIIHLNLIKHFI